MCKKRKKIKKKTDESGMWNLQRMKEKEKKVELKDVNEFRGKVKKIKSKKLRKRKKKDMKEKDRKNSRNKKKVKKQKVKSRQESVE